MKKVEVYECEDGQLVRDLDEAKKRDIVHATKGTLTMGQADGLINCWTAVRDIVDPGAGAQAGRINVLEKQLDALHGQFVEANGRRELTEELLCDVLTNRKGAEHDPFADIAMYLSGNRPDIYPPERAEPGHASDCAVHNEPAYPAGPCDCGRDDDQGEKYPFPFDGVRATAVNRITRALDQTPFSRAVATLVRYIPFSHLPDAINDIEKEYRK